jgi:RHS repeat-associated protein
MTRDRDGVTVTYGYDDSGNLLRMELADGTVRRYAYWENGLLRRAVDGRGYAREFAYDHYGGLTSVTDAEGVLAAFERDRLGRVLRHRDGTGAETVYRYRADGLVSELVDPAGERWRYTYSNRKDLIEIESPLGRSVRYRYDKRHLLLEEDDPRSGTVRYEYRGDRKLRRKIVAGAFRTEYEYGPRGRLVRSHQLESETEHRYAYDLQQRTLVHIQPDGTRVLTRYDSLGRAVRVERGEIVHDYSYTAAGRLLRVTDGTGRSSARRYDSRGRLRVVEDAAGERARFEYGPESRVVARQLRGRAPVEYRYSDRGLPTERREAGRLVERRRVDAAGRTVRLERPGAGSWRYRYTARGRMAEITRDAVPQWSAAYDRDGQPRSVTSPERGTRVYHYDERGRIDGVTHPYERSYRYRYNHRGMVTEVARPDGSVIRYAYDALGHRRSVTDPMGRITRLDLDWRGRLRVRRDPAGVTERFAYDAAGNLVRHDLHDQHHTIGYDAGGRVVSRATGGELLRGYSYDRAGRLSVTRDGSGGRTLYTYRAGRLAAVTDPRGVRRDFQYDRRGNLTRVRATTGEWRSYAHDSYGRLVEARTEMNRLTVSYDGWGRPTRLLQHYGPGTRPLEVSYGYNRAGRISEYALQGIGVRTRFGYGEAGELLTVDTTGVGTVRFVRDALLRETERAYPDGTAVSSAYYLDGRLKARVARGRGGEPIYGQAYRYDEAGREELAVTLGGEVTSFGYDQAGRLAHVSYPYSQERVEAALQERAALGLHPETGLGAATLPGSTIADAPVMAPELLADARALARDTFPLQRSDPGDIRRRWSVSLRYDSAGNRAAKDTPLGTIHYRYDRWHRLTAIGRVRFSHDQAGNLTGVEGPRYGYRMGYTAWNRLSQVERRGVDPGLLSLGVGSVSAGATTGGEPLAGEGAAGAPGGQTRYRYDGLGRLVGLHYMEDGTPREDAQGIAGGSSGADAFTDPGSATFSEVYGFHGFSHQRLTTTTTRADSPLLAGGSLLRREPRRSGGDRALTGAAHLRRVPTDGQSGSAAGAGGSGAAAGAGGPDGRATLGAADTTLGARDTTLYRSCAAAPGAGTAHYAWKRPELYVRASANPAALLFGDCRSGRGFTDVAAFLQDRRGSVTAAVRDHRAHRFRYTVGGRPRSASTPEIGFSGAPIDPITGSYNYPYRSYLPVLGRFTSQDPIAAGLNWYSYAGNDPVNKLDLLGLLGSDIEMLGMGPEDIEPYPDLPLDIVETPVSSSDVGVSPQYFTQDTWAADFGEEFAASACAATSCLNEVSERYTMETGFALETELATDMLQAAVDAGSISSTHAYVNAWEDAANAMWGETGLGGGFVYSYESQPDHTVYAEDTDFDGVPDHFTNSTGPEQFYDPFNGELGSIEELQLQVGLPTRSFDFYD